MNSNKITNLTTPGAATDAANKSYVDTQFGSSGTLENRPTVQRDDTRSAICYLTFIDNSDIPDNSSSKRALLRTDANIAYNANTNTLYATTVQGSLVGNANTASQAYNAVTDTTFRIGHNVGFESTFLLNGGGTFTSYQEKVALVVKPLSIASLNRPYYRLTSSVLTTGVEGYFAHGSPSGWMQSGDDTSFAWGSKTFGGKFVAFFEGGIQLDFVVLSSDKRMKQNITEITDGTSSLQLLRKIKCSTFEYIDKYAHSPYKVHGFIAQDVKDIVPESVHLVSDYLPNFYCMCSIEKYSIQDNDKTETFRVYIPVNDVKKLIFTGNHDTKTGNEYKTATGAPASDASGNQNFKVKFKDASDNDVEVITTRIIDDFSFLIKVPLNDNGINDKIKEEMYFLYGQSVDDFHKIDTEHIHNIATTALQEVDRQQQADKARIAELEAKVSNLEATVATQQSLINDILERLNALERG